MYNNNEREKPKTTERWPKRKVWRYNFWHWISHKSLVFLSDNLWDVKFNLVLKNSTLAVSIGW